MTKKLLSLVIALGLASPVFAQVVGFNLQNRTNGNGFTVNYGSGPCTVVVDGVISASSINYVSRMIR
jgi:hypothetical protein